MRVTKATRKGNSPLASWPPKICVTSLVAPPHRSTFIVDTEEAELGGAGALQLAGGLVVVVVVVVTGFLGEMSTLSTKAGQQNPLLSLLHVELFNSVIMVWFLDVL